MQLKYWISIWPKTALIEFSLSLTKVGLDLDGSRRLLSWTSWRLVRVCPFVIGIHQTQKLSHQSLSKSHHFHGKSRRFQAKNLFQFWSSSFNKKFFTFWLSPKSCWLWNLVNATLVTAKCVKFLTKTWSWIFEQALGLKSPRFSVKMMWFW